MRYRIDWHFIDDDGHIVTKHMKEYNSRKDADKDFLTYIRLSSYGWYNIVQLTEIIIS